MEIRPAKAEDTDIIADLITRSDAGVLASFTGGNAEVLAALIRRSVDDPRILFSHRNVIVAESEGRIVAASFNYDAATLKASKFATAKAMASVFGLWKFICLLPILMTLGSKTRFNDDELYVSNTCVLPELRGRGVGGAIMAYQEARCAKVKLARDVAESNAKWWRHLLRVGYVIDFRWYFNDKRYFRLVKKISK